MGPSNSKKKLELITCGLDNSGKSTIVNYLKPDKMKSDDVSATVGYQMEQFSKGRVNFKVFDMGGAKKFRDLWAHHFREIQAIVFVIDSSDKVRMVLVKDELQTLLSNREVQGTPILFFANKQDIPGALSASDISEQLGLAELCGDRTFNIFPSNALSGSGIDDGIKWLTDTALKGQV